MCGGVMGVDGWEVVLFQEHRYNQERAINSTLL